MSRENNVSSILEGLHNSLANRYPYDPKAMKVSKKDYDRLIKDWSDDLNDSKSEEDIAYNNEFYIKKIYKKKHSPLL